jgi:hypothetical protein
VKLAFRSSSTARGSCAFAAARSTATTSGPRRAPSS